MSKGEVIAESAVRFVRDLVDMLLVHVAAGDDNKRLVTPDVMKQPPGEAIARADDANLNAVVRSGLLGALGGRCLIEGQRLAGIPERQAGSGHAQQ